VYVLLLRSRLGVFYSDVWIVHPCSGESDDGDDDDTDDDDNDVNVEAARHAHQLDR
jgi:hypothetical protein